MKTNNRVSLFHIGTQKAGSTFLYNLLDKHPDISLSTFTEVNFFSNNFDRGNNWYTDSFKNTENKIDTSPKYFMTGETVAPRIKNYTDRSEQKPLFLLILRNPIDYLYSHFQMHLRHNFFKKNPEKFPTLEQDIIKFVSRYPGYLNRAMYSQILRKHWLSHFDISQFKIISFEDFIRNQKKIIHEILSFYGIPTVELAANKTSKNSMLRFKFLFKTQSVITKNEKLKNYLKSNKLFNFLYNNILTTKSSSKMNKENRKKLQNIFKHDVQNLKELLGNNFEYWEDFK
jgi:hypothetical protein